MKPLQTLNVRNRRLRFNDETVTIVPPLYTVKPSLKLRFSCDLVNLNDLRRSFKSGVIDEVEQLSSRRSPKPLSVFSLLRHNLPLVVAHDSASPSKLIEGGLDLRGRFRRGAPHDSRIVTLEHSEAAMAYAVRKRAQVHSSRCGVSGVRATQVVNGNVRNASLFAGALPPASEGHVAHGEEASRVASPDTLAGKDVGHRTCARDQSGLVRLALANLNIGPAVC